VVVEHQQQPAVEWRFRQTAREIEQLQGPFPATGILAFENPPHHPSPEILPLRDRQALHHLVRAGQGDRPVRHAEHLGQHKVGPEHPQAVDLGDVLVGEIAVVHGQPRTPVNPPRFRHEDVDRRGIDRRAAIKLSGRTPGEHRVAAGIKQRRRRACLQVTDPLALHQNLPVHRNEPPVLNGYPQFLPTDGGHELEPPVHTMQSTWKFAHGPRMRPAALGRQSRSTDCG